MLVLSRNINQKIIIGDSCITLSVLDIRDRQVRLGIRAPKDVPIHREEIYHKIKQNGSEKAATAA